MIELEEGLVPCPEEFQYLNGLVKEADPKKETGRKKLGWW